jgi:hypothetical protein
VVALALLVSLAAGNSANDPSTGQRTAQRPPHVRASFDVLISLPGSQYEAFALSGVHAEVNLFSVLLGVDWLTPAFPWQLPGFASATLGYRWSAFEVAGGVTTWVQDCSPTQFYKPDRRQLSHTRTCDAVGDGTHVRLRLAYGDVSMKRIAVEGILVPGVETVAVTGDFDSFLLPLALAGMRFRVPIQTGAFEFFVAGGVRTSGPSLPAVRGGVEYQW